MMGSICSSFTRRGFLGCLVAIPTILVVPKLIVEAADRVSGLVRPVNPGSPLMISGGELYDVIFWYAGKPKDAQGSVGIRRLAHGGKDGVGYDVMQVGMNSRATFRWVAPPGLGIITSEKNPVIIYGQSIPGLEARIAAHVRTPTGDIYFFGDEQQSERVF